MSKILTLSSLFCTGCAIKEKSNPAPTQDFENLDKNNDSVISMQEYGNLAIQSYDYIGPAIWVGVIIGTAILATVAISLISKK